MIIDDQTGILTNEWAIGWLSESVEMASKFISYEIQFQGGFYFILILNWNEMK